jgi:UDP-3-O-[3-hydroxymyristoyl] glucosamine N-acyltransferase
MKATLADIANLVEGKVFGDSTTVITALSPIDNIIKNSLVFAEGDDNLKKAEKSTAAAVLVASKINGIEKPLIQVSNPLKAFITLLNHFYPMKKPDSGVHPTAVVADDVKLGQNVAVGPYVIIEAGSAIGDNCVIKGHVTIGHDAEIGANTTLHPHVTVYHGCKVGQNVTIHASTVIGSDGFGYTQDNGKHLKVPHIGHVVIEDDVEIGANSVIDRATMGATTIGEGTKIDNLVQIAHSVQIGKHNIICAFTGIAGSSTSGDHVIFAANVGVSDHVHIEDQVILGARTGVPPKKTLKQGNVYLGSPARPKKKAIELELGTTRIPIMRKNLKSLTEKVDNLIKQVEQLEK